MGKILYKYLGGNTHMKLSQELNLFNEILSKLEHQIRHYLDFFKSVHLIQNNKQQNSLTDTDRVNFQRNYWINSAQIRTVTECFERVLAVHRKTGLIYKEASSTLTDILH